MTNITNESLVTVTKRTEKVLSGKREDDPPDSRSDQSSDCTGPHTLERERLT